MARLHAGKFLLQQVEDKVLLFEEHTEREIVTFDLKDHKAVVAAQKTIDASTELSAEEKSEAHFYSGYFFGCFAVTR